MRNGCAAQRYSAGSGAKRQVDSDRQARGRRTTAFKAMHHHNPIVALQKKPSGVAVVMDRVSAQGDLFGDLEQVLSKRALLPGRFLGHKCSHNVLFQILVKRQ